MRNILGKMSCVAVTLAAASLLATPALAKPKITILATGGTIAGAAASDVQAGYASGQVGVEQLLAAVPQAKKLAALRGEQIANIGSQDINDGLTPEIPNGDTRVVVKLSDQLLKLEYSPAPQVAAVIHG